MQRRSYIDVSTLICVSKDKMTGRRPSAIGVNLLRLRKAAGLTQEGLAKLAGIHRVTIASLETGGHQGADTETLEALARVLRVRISELTEGDVVTTPIEPLLADFLASPWGQITRATPEELAWLRALPGLVWINVRPNPETLHHMILAYRSSNKPT